MGAIVDRNVDPPVPPEAKPWRLRHPRTARGLLYGGVLLLGAAGYAYAARAQEEARQQGLLTLLHGVETAVRVASPERALEIVREDVLARRPSEDVRRRALLCEAATLDALKRFDDAESAYARLRGEWPNGVPVGALVLPWANMRVRAGRPADALALLDEPGATAGESPEDVLAVRGAATARAVASKPPR
jgi:hypothetical protein